MSEDYRSGLAPRHIDNADGERTKVVDPSGLAVTYTVNYSDKSLGPLAELTDGTAALSGINHEQDP